jgi:copper ion binding protein
MVKSSYTVKGMTCSHCVASVSDEVSGIAGVHDVDVDLTTGKVTITSEEPVLTAKVAAAVTEAGYELVS